MQMLRLVQSFSWPIALMAILLFTPIAGATDYFVKGSVTASGNGTPDFDEAFKYLDEALAIAEDGDRVFVAAGTYNVKGDATSPPRTTTFVVQPGVVILGGFVGLASEDDPAQADPETNITILTGDIGENDPGTLTDNAYHVISITGDDQDVLDDTVIDGFTIRGGVANGTNQHSVGGGAYIADSSMSLAVGPAFRRCKFIGNQSTNGGGAIVGNYIGVHVRDCEFRSNTTAGDGYDNNRGGGAISAASSRPSSPSSSATPAPATTAARSSAKSATSPSRTASSSATPRTAQAVRSSTTRFASAACSPGTTRRTAAAAV